MAMFSPYTNHKDKGPTLKPSGLLHNTSGGSALLILVFMYILAYFPQGMSTTVHEILKEAGDSKSLRTTVLGDIYMTTHKSHRRLRHLLG